MARFLILGLLVAGIITGAVIGCGPRAEVAKDKILAKIDSVLGELDVKRKKIEKKQKELQGKLNEFRKKQYAAEARLELMVEKKEESEKKIEEIRSSLEKLQEKTKSAVDGKIELGGKSFTVDQFQEYTQSKITLFKSENTKLEGMKQGIAALSKSMDFLKSQAKTAKELMDKMAVKIQNIDAKKYAVDAVKQASVIGGETTSINDDLAALEKEIDDLSVDVEATLKLEQSKLDDLNNSTSEIDRLLKETPNLDALNSEIDDILGKGK